MIPYDLQHISLMQIDIFFRCAELMNFTKAAAQLRITPGMVSKKISALETSLGFPLFLREKNRVALTPQGEALYAAWRQPMKTMVRQAQDIRGRDDRNHPLTFLLWESTNLDRFFVPLISALSVEEEVLFRISMSEALTILDDILSGKADVALVPKFVERGIRETEGLDYFLALPSPLYAALSADNPLSRKKTLRVEDLYGQDLLQSENVVSWYSDMVRELCHDHGFTARFKSLDPGVFKTHYLCMDSSTVLITDKYYHAFASSAVEYRELENTESGLILVYKKDPPPQVRQLVKFAWNFYKELR